MLHTCNRTKQTQLNRHPAAPGWASHRTVSSAHCYSALAGVQHFPGAKYRDPCICPLEYLKNMSKLHKTFCTYYPWPLLGSLLMTMQTLCTSGFVDDVTFSHNGTNTGHWLIIHHGLSVALGQSAVSDCLDANIFGISVAYQMPCGFLSPNKQH